jgi:hypothetical protein
MKPTWELTALLKGRYETDTLSSTLFWDFKHRRILVFITETLGQPVGPIFRCQRVQAVAWNLQIEPTAHPEMSAANYHCTLRTSHVHSCGDLQSRTNFVSYIDRIYWPDMEFVTPLIKWDCPPMINRRQRVLVCVDVGIVATLLLRKQSLCYEKVKQSRCRPEVAQRVPGS